MAITVAFETIQDESAGLQISGTQQQLPGGGIEDNDGNDTTLALAPTVVTNAASAYGASLGVAKSPEDTIGVDPNTTALGFTLAGGAALPLDSSGSTAAPSGLSTTAGLAIYLYAEAGNDNVVIGRDTDGNVAFVIVLAETVDGGVITGADFWILQNQAIDHGAGGTGAAHDNLVDLTDRLFVTSTASTELLFDEFDGVSGQNQWLGFAPTNTTNGNYSILLSGLEPTGTGDFDGDGTTEAHTVNTSNALTEDAIGSNSQSVKVGDGVRFEIVSNLDTTADTKDIDTTSYDAHLPLTSAGFKIVQTGANARNPVDAVVSVYTTGANEDGTDFNDGIADDAGDLATLGMVQVFRGTSETPLVQSTGSFAQQDGGGVEILAFSDGIVRINNLLQGDRVVVSSASGTTFNRVLVVNDTNEAAANDTFDIGRFTATTTSSSTETTEVGSFLNFADDGPQLALAAATGAEIRMDESPADGDEAGSGKLASVTATAASLFSATTSAGGTDGLDTTATVYALASTNAASGLIDSQTDEAVTFAKVGNDIVGSSATGGEVLRVSINASTGLVTAVLSRAVNHADGTDPDEADTPATLAAGSVLVEQTIYDTEGDSATASVDISTAFLIEDDGPSIGTNGVISNLTVPFAIGSGGPVDMLVNGGSDGVGSLVVATFTNATGYVGEKNAAGTIVTYYVDDNGDGLKDAGDTTPAFRLTLDASTGSYSFDVLINTPFVREAVSFDAIKAGGPQEIISPRQAQAAPPSASTGCSSGPPPLSPIRPWPPTTRASRRTATMRTRTARASASRTGRPRSSTTTKASRRPTTTPPPQVPTSSPAWSSASRRSAARGR